MPKVINGVNVTELLQTVDAVKADSKVATFRFRLNNEWVHGGQSRSTLNKFYGAKQEFERPQSFILHADEPAVLLGRDQAPNAAEYLLQALAACVTTSLVYHAAARGIEIGQVETRVEGEIDVRGFLGLDEDVRKGFQNIRLTLAIQADVTNEQLDELAALGPSFSPMLDSIKNGVPVTVRTERMHADADSKAA